MLTLVSPAQSDEQGGRLRLEVGLLFSVVFPCIVRCAVYDTKVQRNCAALDLEPRDWSLELSWERAHCT